MTTENEFKIKEKQGFKNNNINISKYKIKRSIQRIQLKILNIDNTPFSFLYAKAFV